MFSVFQCHRLHSLVRANWSWSARMVKRTPRKRNAAAAETSVLEKVSCEEEMEEDKSEETGEGKGSNEIEENPLFEELSEDGEEKLDSSSSTLEDLGASSTSRYKLKRSRQVASGVAEMDAKASDLEDDKVGEEVEEEECEMEIASVETVPVPLDDEEPSPKKSKQEVDEIGSTKCELLEKHVQPEKMKVIELRNQLKVTRPLNNIVLVQGVFRRTYRVRTL